MKCSNCAATLEIDDQFCGVCGSRAASQSSPAAGAVACPRCGDHAELTDISCGNCGFAMNSGSNTVRASTAQSRPPRSTLQVMALIYLGGLLLLSITLGFIGIFLTAGVLYWGTSSELATTFLVAATFLFGLCVVGFLAKVPYLVFLFGSLTWIGTGFVSLQGGLGVGWDFSWWPDIVFATGIANLMGVSMGWVASLIVRKLRGSGKREAHPPI